MMLEVMLFKTSLFGFFLWFSACTGSFGHNCSSPCPDGYFGHGCRLKCDCNVSESCEPENGCTIRYRGGKLYYWFEKKILIFLYNRFHTIARYVRFPVIWLTRMPMVMPSSGIEWKSLNKLYISFCFLNITFGQIDITKFVEKKNHDIIGWKKQKTCLCFFFKWRGLNGIYKVFIYITM